MVVFRSSTSSSDVPYRSSTLACTLEDAFDALKLAVELGIVEQELQQRPFSELRLAEA